MTNAPTEADTYEWLEAIDRHPDMTVAESLAALWVLGVDVDMSETDLYNAVYKLVEFGFLVEVFSPALQPGCEVSLRLRGALGTPSCWG
ncbi:MAG: hypothetical protein KDB71_15560 [Mycobacterium sp.]|nr:hypothetical protein [Mycobacterium sp.]